MTPAQIALLATTGEFDTREFEETTGTRREAAKTVCDRLIVYTLFEGTSHLLVALT